jgi:hypothetical protein
MLPPCKGAWVNPPNPKLIIVLVFFCMDVYAQINWWRHANARLNHNYVSVNVSVARPLSPYELGDPIYRL